jgi:TetR/AcrR family transcriptional repressor of uid operon
MKKTEPTNRAETTRARRKLLIETAITLFVERGLARTSMRDIANKAGVSVGNLYNHFPSRDDFISEIAQMETAGLTDVIAQIKTCATAQDTVDTFVSAYFSHCATPISAVLTIEIMSEALRNPVVERLFTGNREMLMLPLKDAISQVNLDLGSPDKVAGLILDMIEGFALRVSLSGKKRQEADTIALQTFVNDALSSK